MYLLDNSTSFNAQDTFSYITLKLKGNTFQVIAWLVRDASIKMPSLSYSGIIRRRMSHSGQEREGERVAAETVVPNGPDFQVLCPALPTALSLKVEGTLYWVGNGGNPVNKNLQWVKQEYFPGHNVRLDILS